MKQKYEALVNSIDGIVWEADADTFQFTFVSKQAERMLGYPLEDWLHPTFWVDHIHSQDQEGAVRYCVAATKRNEDHQFEYRMIAADGGIVWMRDLVTLHTQDDGTVLLRGVMFDVTAAKLAEEELHAKSEQLRALSASLRSAREEEGRRIGREIHDELGSALTSLRWDLESIGKIVAEGDASFDRNDLLNKLDDMFKLTDTAIGSVRRISSELRPVVLDDLGLIDAIRWQAEQFEGRTGIRCICDCPSESIELDQDQATAVFRIFQEALTNALRHSRATEIKITFGHDTEGFVLTVADNGIGITESDRSKPQSLGLLGMSERAYLIGGELDITGIEDKGTTVTVRIPNINENHFYKNDLRKDAHV